MQEKMKMTKQKNKNLALVKTWPMCNSNTVFLFANFFFSIMIYVADMAILMSNFDNFDHDQIS